ELEINGVVLTQEYAMLKVIFKKPDVITDNMIFNGDFSSGYTDPFVLSQFENGTGTFGVENEELYVNITNIAAAQASPRVDYNDLQLDPDKFYEVRFDARANVPRWLHIQIGQLIDSAPWFYSVDPIERYFHLDTTMQTFSFRFQPSTKEGADMTKISLLFEFGKMKDEAILTTCFLDNIVMQEVDSLGEDTTPPTITAPSGEFIAYVGEKLNVPVTAYDDFDKDITDRLEVSGDEIP
ncbi:MAG TPA: carbohydrate binding domain-containing protein, partial [Bacilli bacterium]|nr:carbohydrate binding domain-containing protein [Bacilli bacterium]